MVALRVALLALFTMSLSLSGCLVGEDDPEAQGSDATSTSSSGTASGNGTAQPTPAANATAPSIQDVQANATGLNLTLTVTAAGDNLTLAVAFGDNATGNGTFATGANGTATAVLNHTYAAAGIYNVTVTVTSGNLSANRTLQVNATAASIPPMEPAKFTGSCTTGAAETVTHKFAVTPGQALIHGTIAIGGGGVDLDWYLIDPSGAEADAAETFTVRGEGPLEVATPVEGEWSFRVVCFAGVAASYTIDAKFA